MMKKIEELINRTPLYNIIRFNPLTNFILEARSHKTQKSIEFYSSFLKLKSENDLIYDIGANKGNKVKAFLRMGFRVIAVEPERKSLSTLHWRFGRNRNVTIVENGISDKMEVLPIYISANRSGLNTTSEKWVNTLESEEQNRWHKKHLFQKSYLINTVTIDQLYSQYGIPYYIKIDVEGYENKVIRGITQMPKFISFETNLPEFLDETIECIEYLVRISNNIQFNYSQEDKLALNTWVSDKQILDVIRNPSKRYMEIICRSTHL